MQDMRDIEMKDSLSPQRNYNVDIVSCSETDTSNRTRWIAQGILLVTQEGPEWKEV